LKTTVIFKNLFDLEVK